MWILAQMQSADSEAAGRWFFGAVLVLGGVLVILNVANAWKKWREQPAPTPDEERFVTHGQFDAFKRDMRDQLSDFRRELKDEMKESNKKVDEDISELTKYLHTSNHDARTSQQTMLNRLSWIQGVMAIKFGIKNEDEQ